MAELTWEERCKISRESYLGEFPVGPDNETNSWTPIDWALKYIAMYGSIDGDHHKTWVIDQVARILHGTPVLVKMAKWSNFNATGQPGEEMRFTTGEPSQAYLDWVKDLLGPVDENGETEYSYDEGIAP
jgi:hypothetical protein